MSSAQEATMATTLGRPAHWQVEEKQPSGKWMRARNARPHTYAVATALADDLEEHGSGIAFRVRPWKR